MAKRIATRRRRRGFGFDAVADRFNQNAPGAPGYNLDRLKRFFRGRRVAEIDSALVRRYALKREEQGGTTQIINLELRTLAQLLRFAVDKGMLAKFPVVEFLPEDLPGWARGLEPNPWSLSQTMGLRGVPVVRGGPSPRSRQFPPTKAEQIWQDHLKIFPPGAKVSPNKRREHLTAKGLTLHRTTIMRRLEKLPK
jgi:hypothetical protein